jgi:outer membrane immunogenic protein
MQVIAAAVAAIASVSGAPITVKADGYIARPVAARPFSWTGFYLGANGGYAWSNDQTVHIDETIVSATSPPTLNQSGNFGSLAPTGGFFGAQAGANLQLGMVVVGIEVDGQWSDIKDSSFATRTLLPDGVYAIGTSNKVQGFGTFRPRLGVAIDRTLIYATGGLAWGRVEHTLNFTCCPPPSFPAVDHRAGPQVGYAVGGGLEHALSPHTSIKLEYQYIDLGSEHTTAIETDFLGGVTQFRVNTDTRTDFHTVRLGLNYKLGP